MTDPAIHRLASREAAYPPRSSEHGASPEQTPRKRKLAEILAERIQADIAAIGWPIGQVLGKEPELLKKYGVSRATLREAVRQLERIGVATMRRGFSGGLVTHEPARVAVVQAMATYLELTDVSLEELFEARNILEMLAVELAINRLSDPDIEALRRDIRAIDELRTNDLQQEVRLLLSIRRTIAEATHNPALGLFSESLNRVTGVFMPPYDQLARMRDGRMHAREARRQLVEAVISGNVVAAKMAIQEALTGAYKVTVKTLRRFKREAGHKDALDGGAAPQVANWEANYKLPHRLALVISRAVLEGRQPPGTRLGSEAEFVSRFQVSRAVFREAVRLLESHGIVRMRRGIGGGIVVGSPDSSLTVSQVATYLRYGKVRQSHFQEVRRALELAVAPMAAARAPADKIQVLQAIAADMAHSRNRRQILTGIEMNMLELIRLTDNRAVELIGLAINAYAPDYGLGLPPMNFCRALVAYHQELLAAVALRDEGLARRKMTQLHAAIDIWRGGEQRKDWLRNL